MISPQHIAELNPIRGRAVAILCRALAILLMPIAVVNFSICFLGVMAVLGLSFDSPLLLQLLALGLGLLAWVMNAATATISAEKPGWIRLLWLAGMPFSVMTVFLYYFSIPTGTGFSFEIIRQPALLAQRPSIDLWIAAIFAAVTAVSPMAVAFLEIRRKVKSLTALIPRGEPD